ncbi:hypothetical protein [Nonomuraea maritima]|uniref:hypothetical protein n=1 Tax=Nonomuraea maritima TaxID=683260 RepID=UPI0037132BD6
MPVPDAQAIQVQWKQPLQRAERLRVRAHTCGCTFPTFELCAAAGLAFVRVFRSEDDEDVWESAWLPMRAACKLWNQILNGQAR